MLNKDYELVKKDEEYNYGLALLRIWLAFKIVCFHFYADNPVQTVFQKYMMITYKVSVPTFMMISFFFMSEKIKRMDSKNLYKRIKRLIGPFWCWGLIYFFVYNILALTGGYEMFRSSWKDLLLQLTFGVSKKINPILYFQWDLVVITVLFFLIAYIAKRTKLDFEAFIIFFAIATECFIYKRLNYRIFGNLPEDLQLIGRLAEMIPFACVGSLFSYLAVVVKREPSIFLRSAISIMFIAIYGYSIYYTDFYLPDNISFMYAGLRWLVLGVCVFGIYYFLPMNVLHRKVLQLIKTVSGYTLGIYCLHYMFGNIVKHVFPEVYGSIESCFAIFAISLLFSVGIGKNSKLKFLVS